MEDTRPYKIPRPKGLEKYILENCTATDYIFFSKKEDWWECTHCGHRGKLDELPVAPKHVPRGDNGKITTRCPHCGAVVTPKDARYGRKSLTDRGRIIWTRGIGRVTVVEVDIFAIDYTTLPPTVRIGPDEQLRLSAKSQERWDLKYWYGGGTSWEKVQSISLRVKPAMLGGRSAYHDHLRLCGTGTDLQYADVRQFWEDDIEFDENWSAKKTIRYMSDFLKYPAIEILEKSGFRQIVEDRAEGRKTKAVNLRAKDLRKILKCDGGDVKKLRREKADIRFLENMLRIRAIAPWAQVEDIDELSRIIGYQDIKNQHENPQKLLRKLLEERRATGSNITLGDYNDYLNWAEKLGWRMDKKTLYPENFKEAHDRAMILYGKHTDRIIAEGFADAQRKITTMTKPWTDGRLLIRPAASPMELNMESKILCHCVRTYAARVADGRTSILFIRKAEDPDMPYFTLELNTDHKIVQCRGNHNCDYPEDVEDFIKKWYAWLLKRVEKLRKAEKEAAKGAGAPAA